MSGSTLFEGEAFDARCDAMHDEALARYALSIRRRTGDTYAATRGNRDWMLALVGAAYRAGSDAHPNPMAFSGSADLFAERLELIHDKALQSHARRIGRPLEEINTHTTSNPGWAACLVKAAFRAGFEFQGIDRADQPQTESTSA